MKELDLLKKDWNKQNTAFPKFSYDDIYKLIHKKSSSIVKWILIICIAELIFWTGINLLVPERYFDIYEQFHLKNFLYVFQALHYVILFVFIYCFYKNYKTISVKDTTKTLMKNIIKTRKTVNYYVYYNIAMYFVISTIFNISMFSQPEIIGEVFMTKDTNIDQGSFITFMLIGQIIAVFVMCGLLWLYYRIIYGFLLKRLNKNYDELATLEI